MPPATTPLSSSHAPFSPTRTILIRFAASASSSTTPRRRLLLVRRRQTKAGRGGQDAIIQKSPRRQGDAMRTMPATSIAAACSHSTPHPPSSSSPSLCFCLKFTSRPPRPAAAAAAAAAAEKRHRRRVLAPPPPALPEPQAAAALVAGLVGVAATLLLRSSSSSSQQEQEQKQEQEQEQQEEQEECWDCGGTGLCGRCKGEGFVFKQLPEEAASKARKAAKNMATRYTAGLPTKWSYCSKCSSTRACTTCRGSGTITSPPAAATSSGNSIASTSKR